MSALAPDLDDAHEPRETPRDLLDVVRRAGSWGRGNEYAGMLDDYLDACEQWARDLRALADEIGDPRLSALADEMGQEWKP